MTIIEVAPKMWGKVGSADHTAEAESSVPDHQE